MAKYTPPPSKAVLAARDRRVSRAADRAIEIQWFIDEVCNSVNVPLRERVRLATELVHSKVVKNISIPVVRQIVQTKSGKSRTRVIERSKPGEYPRVDYAQLMRTLISGVMETVPGRFEGYVGTPLDYGVILELRMNRSFLARSLEEVRNSVMTILSGPIG